jgi:hypothetical protein
MAFDRPKQSGSMQIESDSMQKKGLRVGVTKPEEDGLRQLGGLPRVHEIQSTDELLQNSYTGQRRFSRMMSRCLLNRVARLVQRLYIKQANRGGIG